VGATALLAAAEAGDETVVQMLIDAGADLNAKDEVTSTVCLSAQ
jgi:ankyrin repeat protein